jgi:hypothetical protein
MKALLLTTTKFHWSAQMKKSENQNIFSTSILSNVFQPRMVTEGLSWEILEVSKRILRVIVLLFLRGGGMQTKFSCKNT